MTHNHQGHEHCSCQHCLHYCSVCNIVYCCKCGQTWGNNYNWYPIQPYWPVQPSAPCSPWTVTYYGNAYGGGTTCNHTH